MAKAETSDEALAEKAAAGDRAAFGALLERNYDRLFAFSMKLLGNRAEAEDLTQDICVALPRKLKSFRGESRFTTWLYRVAVNAAHDRRRKSVSDSRRADGWGEWELDRIESHKEAEEAREWLAHAMASLDDDLRTTAVLVISEGFTQAEAAEILDIAPGTVAWRMSEVKKRLQALGEMETAS